MEREEIHVVMVPWLAFGHMIPFFQLSIALAKAGIRVSFVSTPKNIQRLPKLPPNLAPLITMVELPLTPAADHRGLLPEGAEATVDIPPEKMQFLKAAFDLMEEPFKQFVAKTRPDWIVVDVVSHWAADVARECQVPLVCFYAYPAAACAFFGPSECLAGDGRKRVRPSPESMTSPPEWFSFPSSIAYRTHEAILVHPGIYGNNGTGKPDGDRLAKILESCHAIAVRSCVEFECEYLNSLAGLNNVPVIPVGLLPPEPPKERETVTDGPWTEIFEWLDQQPPSSVVFVGFGSECKLTREQVHEISHGLELSNLPFLWALRKPNWAADDPDIFPSDFGGRTSGRGKVCIGWAPQMEILGHKSIGGSLFHSGWGSVIETLQFGHCLVLLPFIIDQRLNARLLVEKGLGIEVERREDGLFTGNDIAESLKRAMVSEEGQGIRARAREAAAVFGDRKLHDQYIADFAEYLKHEAVKQG
ncbi:putative UDP-rhamnose:rhamnosyltransferase 1 [Rhododendron vialii]|uniref:putative UDP-rhamnose:rhamnosyltransferase 1 n=1 Tax=Rhododendron vialii TaxID=182163 RepID=UPI00265F7381|nr:putative UDP-rhamnose:rhamnosyltransferase 1 [Rhododendron vialii]